MSKLIDNEELKNEILEMQFELATQRQLQTEMIKTIQNCAAAIYDMQCYMQDILDNLPEN